jgi:hypothetical protein
MKHLSIFFVSALILLSFACKNDAEEKTETKTSESSVRSDTSTEPTFSPYTVMMIQHRVEEFDKWLAVFNDQATARKENGLSLLTLARGADDSNMVYIRLKVDDKQKAMDFPTLTDTKESMKKSGVSGSPVIFYMNVIRDEKPTTDLKERVLVSHHVKNFDVWLEAFDEKGKQVRVANALIDRTIARDLSDTNKVYIVFDVIDHAKARARIFSPEVEKFMKDAGVDLPPTVQFYKLVD